MSEENALAHAHLGARLALSSFPGTAEEARAFMQRRIALWMRVFVVGVLAAHVAVHALYAAQSPVGWGSWIARPTTWVSLTPAVLFGGISILCASRRVRLSKKALALIDAAAVVLLGAFILLIITFGPKHVMQLESMRALGAERLVEIRVTVAVVAVTNVLYLRALIVPSSVRRTLVLNLVAAAFLVATSFVNRPDAKEGGVSTQLALAVLWSVLPAVGAAAASYVIQGLRAKVQEAAQLGQYTLLEKIGQGGMGAVYKARHALLRRPTAVKLLPPGRARPEDLARFEREVQLTSQLTHPNTIAIYDFGHTPDGVFYYAMELIDGTDLQALVEACGPLPPARVIHILMQIAGSLGEAHGTGLIHRDIKPGNILLCARGGVSDVVKVVDFGLVKDLQNQSGDAGLTDTEFVLGTPDYIAPEALTSPELVDARVDIYAVGAVGYFLLTGGPVFRGKTIAEIMGHHLHTRPAPPSERLGRAVPEDLERLLLRCLEKDPSARPRDAAELRDLLAGCADAGRWTDADARAWWEGLAEGRAPAKASRGPAATVPLSLYNRKLVEGGPVEE